MKTHWNTVKPWAIIVRFSCFPGLEFESQSRQFPVFQVWGSNPSQGNSLFSRLGVRIPVKAIPCFPGWGFESQSRQFPVFQVWGSNPSQDLFFAFFPPPNFLQRSINGEYFSNDFIHWLIYWLIWVVIGVAPQKMALTGIRSPNLATWIFCGKIIMSRGVGRTVESDEKFVKKNCFTQWSNGFPLYFETNFGNKFFQRKFSQKIFQKIFKNILNKVQKDFWI